MSGESIRPLGGETVYEGKTFTVRVERFAHPDGRETEREIVRRPDAVAMVAHDDRHVWLVRQPREAIGAYTLELPAGKLDVEGESPEDCARRELAEEVGLAAERWEPVLGYYASSGYTDEFVHVFAATGLREERAEGDEADIEVVRVALTDLDATIVTCHDAKTVIGLQWLAARLRG
jgi:8-oxo-dGTP pyrophosphatase MutT (NUDIX family)